MSLRARVTLAAGFAVLLAVLAMSIAVYVVERGSLRDQIDRSLISESPPRHDDTTASHRVPPATAPEHLPLVRDAYMQVVDGNGNVVSVFDNRTLPVTADVLAVARGQRQDAFFDADVKAPRCGFTSLRPVRGLCRSAARSPRSNRRCHSSC